MILYLQDLKTVVLPKTKFVQIGFDSQFYVTNIDKHSILNTVPIKYSEVSTNVLRNIQRLNIVFNCKLYVDFLSFYTVSVILVPEIKLNLKELRLTDKYLSSRRFFQEVSFDLPLVCWRMFHMSSEKLFNFEVKK